VTSGTTVASNIQGDDASFSRAALFNFGGAFLTAAWRNNLQVEVSGFLNGVKKYGTSLTLGTDEATYFAFNYLGVDQVLFHSAGGVPAGYGSSGLSIAVDDITYTNAKATPIPGAIWLLGSGLAGILCLRRRFSVN
jgi:hypothetical protein